jgi:hypothetical protein
MLSAFGLQQMEYSGGGGGVGGIIVGIVYLAMAVLLIASYWKIFAKAGQPGWAAIVPIYNTLVLLKIVDKPAWWLILFFIPFVNAIILIIVCIELAKKFGQGAGFGIGLAFLTIIFAPMLAFGSAQYQGAGAAPGLAPARA